MSQTHSNNIPYPEKNRLGIARDLVVFQAKLFIDGIKDLTLSPISLIAGLMGILVGRKPGLPLYYTMRLGKRMERWIDLFGASYPKGAEQPQAPGDSENTLMEPPKPDVKDFDSLVNTLERSFFDQDARSQLSQRSKRQLDALAKRLRQSYKENANKN